MSVNSRKLFVVDTNVLLYDKEAIHSFPGNDVIVPIVVLDELDRFKDKSGVVGESARYVNRFLDELREKGDLSQGIYLEKNDQKLRVEINGFDNIPQFLDKNCADNQIISCALYTQSKFPESKTIVVTKDINFRVKCDAVGLKAEDYYRDRILESDDEMYKGYLDIEVDSKDIIDDLYENITSHSLATELCERVNSFIDRKFYENEFLCIKHDKASFIGVHKKGVITKLKNDNVFMFS